MSTFLKCLLFFFIITSTLFFAQDKSSAEVKSKISSEDKTNAPQTIGETITFNNSENNPIITIMDEGNNAGSIILPPIGVMTSALNKLYNVGGTLYFNGSALGTGGGGAMIIDDLGDAINDGANLFLGSGSGVNDNGVNKQTTGVGNEALHNNSSGKYNTGIGYRSLYTNTVGDSNTAIGVNTLQLNTTGSQNTASGYKALNLNSTGYHNTANGTRALYSNTTGNFNTAVGVSALFSNVAGNQGVAFGYQSQQFVNNATSAFPNRNTSVGFQSLRGSSNASENTGKQNTALGYHALLVNSSGGSNTATGFDALFNNKEGHQNTATGSSTLHNNRGGYCNNAFGDGALYHNETGYYNTAIGFNALYYSYDYNFNTAVGNNALYNNGGESNTAVGYNSLYNNFRGAFNTALGIYALDENTDGDFNTAVGYNAGPTSKNLVNSMALGYNATTTASYQVRIGNSSITSIGGYAYWTNISDIRYKQNIQENVSGLDFILGLRPITYNLNVSAIAEKLGEDMVIDKDGNRINEQPSTEILASRSARAHVRQSGFAAQEVEALANKLGYDFDGVEKPDNENGFYGLRYAEFVVPLVKAIQEQQEIIEKLTKRIENLENGNLGQRAGRAE